MSTTPSMSLPVVMFCHQTHYFAVEAAQVRRQTSVAPVSQESVIAFADLLHGADHSDVDTRCTQWLELVGTTQHFWLGLHSPADLVELSQGDIYRLPLTDNAADAPTVACFACFSLVSRSVSQLTRCA